MSDIEKTQSKTAAAGKSAGDLKAIMYLGPNRPYDLPLMQYQVFNGATPPGICKAALEKHPHFAACFVPVAKAGTAMRELADPKAEISKAALKVAKESVLARQLKNKV